MKMKQNENVNEMNFTTIGNILDQSIYITLPNSFISVSVLLLFFFIIFPLLGERLITLDSQEYKNGQNKTGINKENNTFIGILGQYFINNI